MGDSSAGFRTDTLRNPVFFDPASDTLVLSNHLLHRDFDFRISIPSVGVSYQVTRLRFNNPAVDAPTKASDCVGGTAYLRPDSLDLSGKPISPICHSKAERIVLLQRP